MAEVRQPRTNKHFLLDQGRLKRAQKVLGAKTETQTIEIALDKVINDAEIDREAMAAQARFIKGAVKADGHLEDVFERLGGK